MFYVLVALACGLKDSVRLNNFFTLVNCSIIVIVIVSGSFHSKNYLVRRFTVYRTLWFCKWSIFVFSNHSRFQKLVATHGRSAQLGRRRRFLAVRSARCTTRSCHVLLWICWIRLYSSVRRGSKKPTKSIAFGYHNVPIHCIYRLFRSIRRLDFDDTVLCASMSYLNMKY